MSSQSHDHPNTIALRGGRIIDPAGGRDEVADLFISEGRIVEAVRAPELEMDARNRIIAPGLIDMHVHLREPGKEKAETVATGCAAAVAGGFTTIACMPNTTPVLDRPDLVREVLAKAHDADAANVAVIAAVTVGRAGERLTDFAALADAGAVGFSDDGDGVADVALMRDALRAAAEVDRPIISHCEVAELVRGGVMHEGAVSQELGLPGMPAAAEAIMLIRDAVLAQWLEAPLHLAHVSTAQSVNLLREVKRLAPSITAEVCPHHLALTHESLRDGNADFKMNPPLRTQEDAEALVKGLADGTIDVIASDHAPHTPEEKARGLQDAPNGVIGLESLLAVVWTELVEACRVPTATVIAALTANPARVLRLQKGRLAPGDDADVAVIDPDARWCIDASQFRSKSRNCPFDGRHVTGKVVTTIVGGEIKFHEPAPEARAQAH